MLNKRFLIILLILNAVIVACAHSSDTTQAPVPLAVIDRGLQAAGESESMEGIWISDEDQLSNLMNRTISTTKIPSKTMNLPKTNFAEYGLLLVRMGEKPSGGYGLELMADMAEIENRTALVPVRWIEPKKGSITTQVITYPYLMIRMGKGDFDKIAVIDQGGLVKLLVDVPK